MYQKILSKLIGKVQTNFLYIKNSAIDSEHQYVALGALGFFSFIAYYFIWHEIIPDEYNNVYLRMIGAILCLFLMLKDFWPSNLKPLMPWYWYLVLLYCIPFFFSFMLFKNHNSYVWLSTTMTGLFILILLLDWLSLTILVTLGVGLAWISYITTTNIIIDPEIFIKSLPAYLTIIVSSFIFLYKKERVQEEKINAMAAVGGSIAHELRNPLLAINTGLSGIKKYLPALLGGYQKAVTNNLLKQEEKIRADRYEVLLTIVDDLSAETQYANVMIDMLLLKVTPNPVSKVATICSAFDCIDDAIRRYPFNKVEQARLIEWDMERGDDFKFKGSQLLLVHVLFNLIKNALYFIANARKGKIYIWTESGVNYNKLFFKDTAKGVPAHILPHIFTRFYSKTQTGTGLGLAFCKMVMHGMGGDIICRSQEGQYTEFVLTFPVLQRAALAINAGGQP